MADSELSALRKTAFATLVGVVREWRAASRITTSAGVKPAFVEAMNGKTEQDLGFETWREFIEAAVAAGHVQTERLATSHTAILLPHEGPAVVASWPEKRAAARRGSEATQTQFRLKPDVWAAFVEWQEGHRRLWDSSTCRAFVFPLNENGEPAWTSRPDRFREIEPVTAKSQKEWMREWALTCQATDREALLAALVPDAPLRSFRHELDARGLTFEWRNELQRRVGNHVREWAETQGVAWLDLTVPREKGHPTPVPRNRQRKAQGRTTAATLEAGNRPTAGSSDLERLREIVHRAVDRMSYAELAAIPIRAEHLLGDR